MSQVAMQCLACRRKRVDAICQHCGGSFQHKPSKPRAACGAACASALRGRNSALTQSRKVEHRCQWCQRIRMVSPTYASRRFCSVACTAAARSGPLSEKWKGGITSQHAAFYTSREWKRACAETWRRDRGRCRKCGDRPLSGHVHHIRSWAAAPDLRLERSNLVLLCVECHRWVHSKRNTACEFLA